MHIKHLAVIITVAANMTINNVIATTSSTNNQNKNEYTYIAFAQKLPQQIQDHPGKTIAGLILIGYGVSTLQKTSSHSYDNPVQINHLSPILTLAGLALLYCASDSPENDQKRNTSLKKEIKK